MRCEVRLDRRAAQRMTLPDTCEVPGVSISGYRAWRRGGKPDRTRRMDRDQDSRRRPLCRRGAHRGHLGVPGADHLPALRGPGLGDGRLEQRPGAGHRRDPARQEPRLHHAGGRRPRAPDVDRGRGARGQDRDRHRHRAGCARLSAREHRVGAHRHVAGLIKGCTEALPNAGNGAGVDRAGLLRAGRNQRLRASRGSSRSRRPSPMRLRPSTLAMMATPG